MLSMSPPASSLQYRLRWGMKAGGRGGGPGVGALGPRGRLQAPGAGARARRGCHPPLAAPRRAGLRFSPRSLRPPACCGPAGGPASGAAPPPAKTARGRGAREARQAPKRTGRDPEACARDPVGRKACSGAARRGLAGRRGGASPGKVPICDASQPRPGHLMVRLPPAAAAAAALRALRLVRALQHYGKVALGVGAVADLLRE
jgi:hypothetical protein